MPESRFVTSGEMFALVRYLALAVLALVVVDAGLQALEIRPFVRRAVALAWLVGLPIGGWLVWRRRRRMPH
jgi:hypothetical protein